LIIPFPVQWEEVQVLRVGQDKPLGQQGMGQSRPAEGLCLGLDGGQQHMRIVTKAGLL